MSTAFLYIRVSTDEQAVKGYSQRSQLDRLTKFCSSHAIQILQTIFEDHSAKTFDRPGWSNLITVIRKNKLERPNLILFTKWDRFSRNVGEAYKVIAQLQAFNIQPKAIDQELDFSIPENKIILAVYLAASEAENERRSLNVKQGIHKAKEEGKWIAHLPLGYKYELIQNHQKIMVPKEPEATLIQQAFELVAKNTKSVAAVYRDLSACGLTCSISHIWRILRNPVYFGMIPVPPFEQEKFHLVKGTHAPIVGESLFNQVQDTLKLRGQAHPVRNNIDANLFLRGFFSCPMCGRILTGSASKGKSLRYYYYHCNSKCGFRTRADKSNASFVSMLGNLQMTDSYLHIFKDIIKSVRKELFNDFAVHGNSTVQNIDWLINRIHKAKDLLAAGEIEPEDYQIIKEDCEHGIKYLGIELQKSAQQNEKRNRQLEQTVLEWANMEIVFSKVLLIEKREILKTLISGRPPLEDPITDTIIIKPAAKRIFGIAISEAYDETEIPNSDLKHYHSYDEKMVSNILSIEKKAKCEIHYRSAVEVIDLLYHLARIAAKGIY